jgi:hypothetical protein
MKLILENLLSTFSKSTQLINQKFSQNNLENQNYYNLFEQVPNFIKVKYIFIIVLSIFFFNFINVNISHLTAVIIAIVIIFYFINKDNNNFITFFKSHQDKIDFLNSILFSDISTEQTGALQNVEKYLNFNPMKLKSYLYLDPVVVQFFYLNNTFVDFHYTAYKSCLIAMNYLIYMHELMKKPGMNYAYLEMDVAYQLRTEALNNLHSIIYKLPPDEKINNQYEQSMRDLLSITDRLLIDMVGYLKNIDEKKNINIFWKPLNIFQEQPDDTKLIDFKNNFAMFS